MVLFKETSLEIATTPEFYESVSNSPVVKAFNRRKNKIRYSLLNSRINIEHGMWITIGFIIMRYGAFELFVRLLPMLSRSPLTSDGFTLLFVLASTKQKGAANKLRHFFEHFPHFDVNKTDKYGRRPLHYVKSPEIYRLLVEHGAIETGVNEYMIVTGNQLVFSLTSNFDFMIKTMLEHGTACPRFAKELIRHANLSEDTLPAVWIHIGMHGLFSEEALRCFSEANDHGASIPTDNYIELFDYCCEYLKSRQPGHVNFVMCCVILEDNISMLGASMTDVQANALKHHAYMRLVRIVLQEAPDDWYNKVCGMVLTEEAKVHCAQASGIERLEIAEMMVNVPLPYLTYKLQWYLEWIYAAYQFEENQSIYHPIIYRLAKIKNEYDQNVLHVVCNADKDDYEFSFFKLLLEMGAEVDARDVRGQTPLFLLGHSYREQQCQVKAKMAELLLERGAHVDVPDRKRKINVNRQVEIMVNKTLVPSLQCLCARKVQDNRKNLRKKLKVLPGHVKSFVDLH